MRLRSGKVGPAELKQWLFPLVQIRDRRVILGPGPGLDAAAISFKSRILVLSSDPITGALENLGWLAVNINANDVAVLGAAPRWFLSSIFLPEGSTGQQLMRLAKEIQSACDELGISLVGGHTEVTPGIDRTIVSGAMIGETSRKRLVTPAGAKPGDIIILTKSAGIEGTAVLASDRGDELAKAMGRQLVIKAQHFLRRISIVREALIAAKLGASAMHDPTEGGVLGGLHELAEASGVGFEVEGSKIPVEPETTKICKYFRIDPLRLISSGALLITAKPTRADIIVKRLRRAGIQASKIGRIVRSRETRLLDGKRTCYPKQDHLWRVFSPAPWERLK